ncbi:MAG: hypothetical protein EPO24_07800 [Bacteroidetes bacterium]|nr:MAG: hypothetical protein EPO24_07800 [Bacteroidota bacterium]
MSGDKKKYCIGGIDFVLRDLTFGDLRQIAPFEHRLRRMMARTAESAKSAESAIEFTIELDNAVYSNEMLDFLDVILVPKKISRVKEFLGSYRRGLEKITETAMQEVLSDFFSRRGNGKQSRGSDTTG